MIFLMFKMFILSVNVFFTMQSNFYHATENLCNVTHKKNDKDENPLYKGNLQIMKKTTCPNGVRYSEVPLYLFSTFTHH